MANDNVILNKNICLTFEAIWFKVYMDSGNASLYNCNVYIPSKGMAGDINILYQLIGDIGGFATNELSKDINVIVIPDSTFSALEDGQKDGFIIQLENLLNNTKESLSYRGIRFVTERLLLQLLKNRFSADKAKNQSDSSKLSEEEKNNKTLTEALENAIKWDEEQLEKINRYKRNEAPAKPVQLNLFE